MPTDEFAEETFRDALRAIISAWLAENNLVIQQGPYQIAETIDALVDSIIALPSSEGSWTALEDAARGAVVMIDRFAAVDGPPKDADAWMSEVREAIVAQIGPCCDGCPGNGVAFDPEFDGYMAHNGLGQWTAVFHCEVCAKFDSDVQAAQVIGFKNEYREVMSPWSHNFPVVIARRPNEGAD